VTARSDNGSIHPTMALASPDSDHFLEADSLEFAVSPGPGSGLRRPGWATGRPGCQTGEIAHSEVFYGSASQSESVGMRDPGPGPTGNGTAAESWAAAILKLGIAGYSGQCSSALVPHRTTTMRSRATSGSVHTCSMSRSGTGRAVISSVPDRISSIGVANSAR
jgi:hypothetical protein